MSVITKKVRIKKKNAWPHFKVYGDNIDMAPGQSRTT